MLYLHVPTMLGVHLPRRLQMTIEHHGGTASACAHDTPIARVEEPLPRRKALAFGKAREQRGKVHAIPREPSEGASLRRTRHPITCPRKAPWSARRRRASPIARE